MLENLVFLLVGALLGFFANVLVLYFQYKHSIAGSRVDWVAGATLEFTERKSSTEELRNRYRYSLGVIIDDLVQADPITIRKPDGSWPLLVNYPKEVEKETHDRWQRFDNYVRPVMNDVSSFAFLGAEPYREFSPRLRRLHYLSKLLIAIEDVVMRIDAAHDALEITATTIKPSEGLLFNDAIDKQRMVQQGYLSLYDAWKNWLQECESRARSWSNDAVQADL